MKKVVCFLLFFSILSCSKDKEDDVTYAFTSQDYLFIPHIYNDTEKDFVFRNQLDEVIVINVKSYNITTSYIGSMSISNESSHPGYYEQLDIELEIKHGQDECIIHRLLFQKKHNNEVFLFFDAATQPTECISNNRSFITERKTPPYEVEKFTFNNVNYSKTTLFFENHNEPSPFFISEYNIDKIYFDFEKGIIGFDDTNQDVQFRLDSQ